MINDDEFDECSNNKAITPPKDKHYVISKEGARPACRACTETMVMINHN